MVYVNEKQLHQVEYILEQSVRGHHVLFDNDDIRKAFEAAGAGMIPWDKEAAFKDIEELLGQPIQTEAEKHIENLILQPTLLSKRIYLEGLTPEMFVQVVRAYFNIIESNIFEESEHKH